MTRVRFALTPRATMRASTASATTSATSALRQTSSGSHRTRERRVNVARMRAKEFTSFAIDFTAHERRARSRGIVRSSVDPTVMSLKVDSLRVAYQGVPGAYSEGAAVAAYEGCVTVPK